MYILCNGMSHVLYEGVKHPLKPNTEHQILPWPSVLIETGFNGVDHVNEVGENM